MIHPFPVEGRWYKGNLHMHTTASDGRLELADAIEFYKTRGYDFVAVTDHRKTTPVEEFTTDTFLAMHGIELNCWDPNGYEYHIVGVGVRPFEQDPEIRTGQGLIDQVLAHDGVAFIAHPYWLGLERQAIEHLTGAIGIEVYNSGCMECGKALSDVHWDDLLHHGYDTWGLATDDTHHYSYDGAVGWVMVRARELTQESIKEALRAGHFYATQGPEIRDLRVEGGWIHVETSDVARIVFVSNRGRGKSVWAKPGETLNKASMKHWSDGYCRIEAIDAQGRKAWSQPIRF